MDETPSNLSRKSWLRHVPLALVGLVAIVGAVTLGDVLSFDTLRDNREALLAFRDQNYAVMALSFLAAYIVIVALSLPGAAVASVGVILLVLVPLLVLDTLS